MSRHNCGLIDTLSVNGTAIAERGKEGEVSRWLVSSSKKR